jgi:hypothetical protein
LNSGDAHGRKVSFAPAKVNADEQHFEIHHRRREALTPNQTAARKITAPIYSAPKTRNRRRKFSPVNDPGQQSVELDFSV